MVQPIIRAENAGEVAHEARVQERVRRKLWEHEPLRESGALVQLEYHQGTVRLTGRVRTRTLREMATYLAKSVDGVGEVRNELLSDPDVVLAVADALAADPVTRPHVIRVEARLGHVKLLGVVPSAEIERRALSVAATVPVASGAVSELEVDPQVAVPQVVEAAPAEGADQAE